jgi:hypothetical protein
VLVATCLLEFLQLWHPPLLEAVRSTFIGRTVLGTSFTWNVYAASTMDVKLPNDFKEFLRLLNSYQVEYLLVGGYAVGDTGRNLLISFSIMR